MSRYFFVVVKLELLLSFVFVSPVFSKNVSSTQPTSAKKSSVEVPETRILPVADCVLDMIRTGKAKSVQEAEDRLVAILSKEASPLAAGEWIEIRDHQLVVTLRSSILSFIEKLIYPEMEVTVYTILLPKDDEEKIGELLPGVPSHRSFAKPIEWRLTDEQFSPILNANLDIDKQTKKITVGDIFSIMHMQEINPMHPHDIPPGQYYTTILGINFDGFLEVRPAPNDKEYQLNYFFMYSMEKYLHTHDKKVNELKDKTRIYGAVSFSKDRVYVQRIPLNESVGKEYVELFRKLEKKGSGNVNSFKDPNRNLILYLAFKVKPVDSARILNLD